LIEISFVELEALFEHFNELGIGNYIVLPENGVINTVLAFLGGNSFDILLEIEDVLSAI
jgi:hypothetical protein